MAMKWDDLEPAPNEIPSGGAPSSPTQAETPKWDDLIDNPKAPPGLGERAVNTASAIGQGLYDLPVQTKGYIANVVEGGNPLNNDTTLDVWAKEAAQRSKERSEQKDAESATLLGTKKDWQSSMASLPFSVGSLVGAAGGGILGGFPGSAIGAGALAYRADKGMFTRNALDAYAEKYKSENKGREPTREELLAEQERLQPYAEKHGLWEAVPEGVGTPIAAGLLGKVFTKGGGSVLKKGAKAVAGIAAEELPTETVTQMGQQRTEAQAGMTSEQPRDLTSLSDWQKSLGEVVIPTIQQSLMMGGGAAGARKIYDYATRNTNPKAVSETEGETEQKPSVESQQPAAEPTVEQPTVEQPTVEPTVEQPAVEPTVAQPTTEDFEAVEQPTENPPINVPPGGFDVKESEDFLNGFERAWAGTPNGAPLKPTKRLADEASKLGINVAPSDDPKAVIAAMRAEIEARKPEEQKIAEAGNNAAKVEIAELEEQAGSNKGPAVAAATEASKQKLTPRTQAAMAEAEQELAAQREQELAEQQAKDQVKPPVGVDPTTGEVNIFANQPIDTLKRLLLDGGLSPEEKTQLLSTLEDKLQKRKEDAQNALTKIDPADALRRIAEASESVMPNHPSVPTAAVTDGTWAGSGALNIDADGNVILQRVAGDVSGLTKEGAAASNLQNLIDQSMYHGGGLTSDAISTSGNVDFTKGYAIDRFGEDRTVGTFKIPLNDLLDMINRGEATIGNIGEGEILLAGGKAAKYLSEINGKPIVPNQPEPIVEEPNGKSPNQTEETTSQEIDRAENARKLLVSALPSGDLNALTGKYNADNRAALIEALTGTRPAKSKATSALLRRVFYEAAGVDLNQTIRDQEKQFSAWATQAQEEAATEAKLEGAGITQKYPVDFAAHKEAAASRFNGRRELPENRDAQKKAYTEIQGMPIGIENPEGSVRKGKGWENVMKAHYGFFTGVKGADGDQLDLFVKPKLTQDALDNIQSVFVVDQINPSTKIFDEAKVMLGYKSLAAARKAYLENYTKGWRGLGAITEIPLADFKARIETGEAWDSPVAYTQDKTKTPGSRTPPKSTDELQNAIGKLGGIDREIADRSGFSDYKGRKYQYLFNKSGAAKTLDEMAEILRGYGYEVDGENDLIQKLTDSLNGTPFYTPEGFEAFAEYTGQETISDEESRARNDFLAEVDASNISQDDKDAFREDVLNGDFDSERDYKLLGELIEKAEVEELDNIPSPLGQPKDSAVAVEQEAPTIAEQEEVPETELTAEPEQPKGKPVAADFLKLMQDFNRQQEKKYRLVDSDVKPTIGKGGRLHAPHNGYEWIDGNIYAGGQWLAESEDSIRGGKPSRAAIETTPEVAAYLEEQAKNLEQIRVYSGKTYEKNGENRQLVYIEGGNSLTKAITDLAPSRNKVLMSAAEAEAKGLTLGKTWKYSYKKHFNEEVKLGVYLGSDKSLDKQIVGYYYPDAVIRDIGTTEPKAQFSRRAPVSQMDLFADSPGELTALQTKQQVADYAAQKDKKRQGNGAEPPPLFSDYPGFMGQTDIEDTQAPLEDTFKALGKFDKAPETINHPDAERIRYVQDNFLDLLSELDTNNKVQIKCD